MPPKALQSTSSWADETDDDKPVDLSEVLPMPAPAPPKAAWKKPEVVQPKGLVFEDFEVKHPHRGSSSHFTMLLYMPRWCVYVIMHHPAIHLQLAGFRPGADCVGCFGTPRFSPKVIGI